MWATSKIYSDACLTLWRKNCLCSEETWGKRQGSSSKNRNITSISVPTHSASTSSSITCTSTANKTVVCKLEVFPTGRNHRCLISTTQNLGLDSLIYWLLSFSNSYSNKLVCLFPSNSNSFYKLWTQYNQFSS